VSTALKAIGVYGLLRTLHHSWRYSESGREHLDACLSSDSPTVVAFFHGRTFVLLQFMCRPGNGSWMSMCSKSSDGDAMAWIEQRLGLEVIRGSSGSGGLEAIVDMIRFVRANPKIGPTLAVDGSRGPRGIVKGGVISLAQRTGGKILPISASASRAHIFKRSWDQTMLPLPFARVELRYGEPLSVPAKPSAEQFEAIRSSLESRLRQLQRDSDISLGRIMQE
jgi:lysophospholipid acyltransferase (LPLAT)-like uncharacterized protein